MQREHDISICCVDPLLRVGERVIGLDRPQIGQVDRGSAVGCLAGAIAIAPAFTRHGSENTGTETLKLVGFWERTSSSMNSTSPQSRSASGRS